MVSRRTNFGERSEPAPDRGGKLQSAGGGGGTISNVSPLYHVYNVCRHQCSADGKAIEAEASGWLALSTMHGAVIRHYME